SGSPFESGRRGFAPAPAVTAALLGVTEGLDLLQLLRRELAGELTPGDLLGLHLLPDVLHYLRIRECCDVSGAGEVGDPGDDPAHDLARPRLGHVGDDPHVL